jgi:putative methanogen marker protein 4
MISQDQLLRLARSRECNIGIGNDSNSREIIDSIQKCQSQGLKQIVEYSNHNNLIADLFNGKIEAGIRGNLSSKNVLNIIKEEFQVKEIIRISVLRTASNKTFILAPVGIDEGSTIEAKINIIKHSIEFLELFDMKENIAVLSGGRKEDQNRSRQIDETLISADNLTSKLKSMGLKCKNFDIRIEDAVKESNIIIVPDGIIGNYIFRTLYHLGAGTSLGAPILNIPKTFIDTSRTKQDYSSSLIFTAAYHNAKNQSSKNPSIHK